jgi:hypothetical protein
MSGSPETTNLILLWLVIVTSLTPVLLVAAGVVAMRAWRDLSARVDRELVPLLHQARATLDEAGHVTAIVRRRVDEADHAIASLQDSGAVDRAGRWMKWLGALGLTGRLAASALRLRAAVRAR